MNIRVNYSMKKSGITLVALVITIIILLILAGVTLGITIGKNGILKRTELATKEHDEQEAKEIINLKIANIHLKSYEESEKLSSLQYLADKLCEDEDIEYVIKKQNDIATLQKIDVSDVNSIYTKLKKYPYEFEIDGNMKLASVEEVKASTEEQEKTKQTNPKLLLTLKLPSTGGNERPLGTYYANTSAFTKSNTESFEQYFSLDENNKWIVQKSGNYLINTLLTVHKRESSDSYIFMTINETNLRLAYGTIREADTYYTDANNTTLYLEKGTRINFYNTVAYGKPIYHTAEIMVYAMFE